MHVLWKTLRSMIWWKWCVYCSLHKHSWYHLIKIVWSLHNGYFHSLQLSSFMGGSLSEIREDGEMSLWKEEYTPASYWGCLPRGFLTWALHRRRTDVSLPCGFLWWAWNSLKAHALARVRWIEEGKRKERRRRVNVVFICYSTFSWVTVPVLKNIIHVFSLICYSVFSFQQNKFYPNGHFRP